MNSNFYDFILSLLLKLQTNEISNHTVATEIEDYLKTGKQKEARVLTTTEVLTISTSKKHNLNFTGDSLFVKYLQEAVLLKQAQESTLDFVKRESYRFEKDYRDMRQIIDTLMRIGGRYLQ